ncbi:hypothetical protein AMR72_00010 [Flavobacterium psychrophilum]|nr:hypothetical protein AMR72_00010 [Flavobacterium psychrophilum]AOE51041.1 hypothetical protein ALW18_00010 [Flavobacterium psychrophilum]
MWRIFPDSMKGPNWRFFSMLADLPLILFLLSTLKSKYPNDEPKNLIRGIIVTYTMFACIYIMKIISIGRL